MVQGVQVSLVLRAVSIRVVPCGYRSWLWLDGRIVLPTLPSKVTWLLTPPTSSRAPLKGSRALSKVGQLLLLVPEDFFQLTQLRTER